MRDILKAENEAMKEPLVVGEVCRIAKTILERKY
jgi:hypothetical protein